jgi:hypothetical protein
VNVAEAAFPPSGQRHEREEETAQGKTACQSADRQRAD